VRTSEQGASIIMISSKVAAGMVSAMAAAWLCICALECLADDKSPPPINASGKGMTNAQLEETRPVLSGLKSVDEAYQIIKLIQEKSREIVGLCTNAVPVQRSGDYDTGQVITGPFSKTDGKYYVAPKLKLLEIAKCIERQKLSLADLLSQNRQDQRRLRASEETCKKIELLRAEARELLVPLGADMNKLTSMISSSANQGAIVSQAKDLIRSSKPVEAKLRDMEKVLKRESRS
jgi:hypothetical protein